MIPSRDSTGDDADPLLVRWLRGILKDSIRDGTDAHKRDGTDSLPFRFLFSFFSQDCRKTACWPSTIESIQLQPFTALMRIVDDVAGTVK